LVCERRSRGTALTALVGRHPLPRELECLEKCRGDLGRHAPAGDAGAVEVVLDLQVLLLVEPVGVFGLLGIGAYSLLGELFTATVGAVVALAASAQAATSTPAEMTQSEIGKEMGISQMHVSRLLTRALSRLRSQLLVEE